MTLSELGIPSQSRVIVAPPAGPDSLAALDVLAALAPEPLWFGSATYRLMCQSRGPLRVYRQSQTQNSVPPSTVSVSVCVVGCVSGNPVDPCPVMLSQLDVMAQRFVTWDSRCTTKQTPSSQHDTP